MTAVACVRSVALARRALVVRGLADGDGHDEHRHDGDAADEEEEEASSK